MHHSDRTRVSQVCRAQAHRPRMDADACLAAALERLMPQRMARMGKPVLATVALWEEGMTVRVRCDLRFAEAADGPPLAITLGRHDVTDIGGLPDASLRHAVALAWPGASDDDARLELLDLNTSAGLVTPSGVAARRLVGCHGLRASVGVAEVVVAYAPAWEPLPAAPERWVCRRTISHPGPMEAPLPRPAQPRAQAPRRDSWVSYVRRMREQEDTGRFSVGWASGAPAGWVGPDGAVRDPRDGRIVHPGAWRTLGLTDAQLDRGVLLGRYERCAHHGYFGGDDRVSRVHALLLRRHGAVWVIDAGSTNGTAVVREDGSMVELDEECRAAAVGTSDTIWLGALSVQAASCPG